MQALVVFNTIINLVVICLFMRDRLLNRVEFYWCETFWQKKPYGFGVWLWRRPRNSYGLSNSAKPIFRIQWVSEYWLSDTIEGKRKAEKHPNSSLKLPRCISAFCEGWMAFGRSLFAKVARRAA